MSAPLRASAQAPEYLVVGHVTEDLRPDGLTVPGGTATYSALYAHALGTHTAVLTSAAAIPTAFDDRPNIEVCCRVAPQTTTFENIYEDSGRRQYVRGVAEPLITAHLPAEWSQSAIVHLGPLVQEVEPAFVDRFPDALLCVTPQGWLRQWDDSGLVSPARWTDAERLLRRIDILILSLEDLGGDVAELERLRRMARLLVLTDGRHGATVYDRDLERRIPAYDVEEVDPTGAGDVFATGFFIRYYETRDAVEAARFGNCLASFLVESAGASRIPSREQVDERLTSGRLRE